MSEYVVYLEQADVNKYARLVARVKVLDTSRKALKKDLLYQLLKDGKVCPKRGPWLVKPSRVSVSLVNWEKEYRKLARRVYGTKKAVLVHRAVKKNAESHVYYKLLVETNPYYLVKKRAA